MYYHLIECERRSSILHVGWFYRLVFQDIETQCFYETMIDPKYRNFKNWQNIIENSHKGLLINNVMLKTTNNNKTFINADSKPEIVFSLDNPKEMETVFADWRATKGKFNQLFE